jgi:hypothetical protein
MCEILIKAHSNYSLADIDKDRATVYKKGDPIVAFEDGHVWGAFEGLPDFVIIKCTGCSVADVTPYLNPWIMSVDYTVVNHQISTDGYRIDVWAEVVSPSDVGAITKAQAEQWLQKWGCINIITQGINAVRFDMSIFILATSNGFWGRNVGSVIFSELSYNQSTGAHQIQADYSAKN